MQSQWNVEPPIYSIISNIHYLRHVYNIHLLPNKPAICVCIILVFVAAFIHIIYRVQLPENVAINDQDINDDDQSTEHLVLPHTNALIKDRNIVIEISSTIPIPTDLVDASHTNLNLLSYWITFKAINNKKGNKQFAMRQILPYKLYNVQYICSEINVSQWVNNFTIESM